jgi:hypothetical protein
MIRKPYAPSKKIAAASKHIIPSKQPQTWTHWYSSPLHLICVAEFHGEIAASILISSSDVICSYTGFFAIMQAKYKPQS